MTSPELCKRRDRLPLISRSACGVNIKITHPWSAAQRFADLVCFPLRNPDGIVVQRQLPRPTTHQQQKPWGCRLQRSANPAAASHGKKPLWRAQALPDQLPKSCEEIPHPSVKLWLRFTPGAGEGAVR